MKTGGRTAGNGDGDGDGPRLSLGVRRRTDAEGKTEGAIMDYNKTRT